MAYSNDLGNPSAFIFHHTGGRGTPEGVQATLRQRGLGVQYVMDRDGNITQIGGAGASHIRPGSGAAGAGLSNANTIGMEVIARDNKDVTPQQVAAAQKFIAQNYPNLPVYGHGEVNPGHKEADEGMAIVGAIRDARTGQPVAPAAPLAFAPPPAQPPQMGGAPMPLYAQSDVAKQPNADNAAYGMSKDTGITGAPQSLWSMLQPSAAQAPGLPLFGQQMTGNDLNNWWGRQAPQG